MCYYPLQHDAHAQVWHRLEDHNAHCRDWLESLDRAGIAWWEQWLDGVTL